MCGSVLTELLRTRVSTDFQLLGPLVGRWSNWSSCEFLRLGEPRCEWLLSCLGRELIRNDLGCCLYRK